jgi:hypothetical protein
MPEAAALYLRGDYDKDISKLLDEIPRATSAPPHLQDRWAMVSVFICKAAPCCRAIEEHVLCVQGSGDPVSSSRGWTPIEHTDIRYDEDYARFYEAYAGQKKLPPPVEGRTLYTDLGLLQQQKQMLQQAALLGTGPTPPPSQAALMMGGGLTPGGRSQQSLSLY